MSLFHRRSEIRNNEHRDLCLDENITFRYLFSYSTLHFLLRLYASIRCFLGPLNAIADSIFLVLLNCIRDKRNFL